MIELLDIAHRYAELADALEQRGRALVAAAYREQARRLRHTAHTGHTAHTIHAA